MVPYNPGPNRNKGGEVHTMRDDYIEGQGDKSNKYVRCFGTFSNIGNWSLKMDTYQEV